MFVTTSLLLTRLSQQTRQVAEMAKRCTPSQTDVIFVAMDALVMIHEDDLIAMNSVTAMPLPCALDRSCPNQLTANRHAHASCLSSILARQKMRMKVVQVQDDCFHLAEFQSSSIFFRVFFMASSILSSLAFKISDDLLL